MGPDGSLESASLAAKQLLSPSTEYAEDDGDISFDPSQFDREGDPSNSPSLITIATGGEDWLSVNFHVNFREFEELAKKLDAAQLGASREVKGDDEIQFGDLRFLVAARGAKQGRGPKSVFMRWRLTAENGLVVLLMNRAESHRTMPNASVRATSLLLMRLGFDRVWELMRSAIAAMGGEIVSNKLSRVDPCVDLPGMEINEFVEPFQKNWIVSRSRKRANYAVGTFVNEYLVGKQYTGFTIGKSPLMCRVYDKLVESQRDPQKLAVLQAMRWGGLPASAPRVELQIERGALKRIGVDTVEDWIEKRSDVVDSLMTNWLRLTVGPVDRQHAYRTPVHPSWKKAHAGMLEWCGKPAGIELRPLPKIEITSSRQIACAIGIFCGMFARIGKDIDDNEGFIREVVFALRDGIGDRNMGTEVGRKALELGVVRLCDEF